MLLGDTHIYKTAAVKRNQAQYGEGKKQKELCALCVYTTEQEVLQDECITRINNHIFVVVTAHSAHTSRSSRNFYHRWHKQCVLFCRGDKK